MSFGENLKRARTSIGMTQAELARRTGITERSIYNYARPKSTWWNALHRHWGCSRKA